MTGQWACLAFYVASASYRAFRARNLEATVLLGSAILVMLGATPVGGVIWSKFPVIQRWLIDIPNMTGQRALLIGAAVELCCMPAHNAWNRAGTSRHRRFLMGKEVYGA